MFEGKVGLVKIEGKVGLIRFVKVKVDKVGLQIKCLLELNCVCPVPLSSARVFVTLGSRVVERYQNTLCRQGAATMDQMLTVVGVEPKERESPMELLFYDGRHVTTRGCCWSVKQDHQFLTKIFYKSSRSFILILISWVRIVEIKVRCPPAVPSVSYVASRMRCWEVYAGMKIQTWIPRSSEKKRG